MLLMYISINHMYVKTSSWSNCKFLTTLCSGLVRVQMRFWPKLLNWSPRKQLETSRLPIKNMFFLAPKMAGNRPEVSFKTNGWIGRIYREVSFKMGVLALTNIETQSNCSLSDSTFPSTYWRESQLIFVSTLSRNVNMVRMTRTNLNISVLFSEH